MQQIVLIAGHGGSGKTTLSKHLAAKTSWPILDKDTLTQPLVEYLAKNICSDPYDRHSSIYLNKIRPLEYDTLLAVMWEIIQCGSPGIIVTAPFTIELMNPKWLDSFLSKCTAYNYKLLIIWISCKPNILKKRITARNANRDHWKLHNWTLWISRLTTPVIKQKIPQIIIDNNSECPESIDTSIKVILDHL